MTSRADSSPALWRRIVVRPAPVPTDLPRWLVGDWSRVIRDPLDLLRLVPLVGAIVSVALGETAHLGEFAGISLIVLAPRVLDVQRPFDLAFQIGMNLALWGNVAGLFDAIYGYDKVVHFMLPCGTAMLLYIALCRLRLVPDLSADAGLHDRVAMIVVTLAFGLAVGGLFEMWEWFSNTLFGTHMYVSYGDSIGDLIDDALGALVGGLILLLWTGRGWGTWRIPGAALRGEIPVPAAPPERNDDLLARFGDRIARLRPPRGHRRARVRPFPVAVPLLGLVAAAAAYAAGSQLAARAVASASVAALLYLGLVRLRVVPQLAGRTGIHERTGIRLTATSLGFGAGMLYEIWAWAADGVLDAGASTFEELIAHMAIVLGGSLLGAELLIAWGRRPAWR
jgi:hypothetical protein